ncbi:MAG: 4-alpha-glucanotransferase [Actinomycetia bacterium]|nr:4-alpha-glucanotransferase [Actinomycetes bacterium]
MERGAGVLYPLPTLGSAAYDFVDFLVAAGQRWWQILPLGPTGESLSPYQSRSAFAGNPALLDPAATGTRDAAGSERFRAEAAAWIADYALFVAVKAAQKGRPLPLWPDELRCPDARILIKMRERYRSEIEAATREQQRFFQQWYKLKRYANGKGLRIIGDLPIYVGEDSADFWLRRSAFDVDSNGRPASSAGVPPDAFSATGQIWNAPVYDWKTNCKEVLRFWRDRLSQAAGLYDGIRIDHFRAFADFYAVALDGSGAGQWRPGPGRAFADMIRREYPDLLVIAEDLGELSEAARKLVKDSGFPDMKVLQFAFDSDAENPHLPHKIAANSICYTGTHDNDTLRGWLDSRAADECRKIADYLGAGEAQDLADALITAALASEAQIAIIPIQDWLGLGSEARLNTPGTTGGRNWRWRIPQRALTPQLAARIRHATKRFNRM